MAKSTHLPEVAHGEVTVTGEAVVDTGLRNLKSFSPSFQMSNFAADQERKISWYKYAGSVSKVVVRVEKGGANEGLLGTNPVVINWTAMGD